MNAPGKQDRLLIAGFAAAVLAIASPPARAGSCGAPPPAPRGGYGDRSWIQSEASVYGVSDSLGLFKLRLNSNRPEPIGRHAGGFIDNLEFSADHRKLIYEISDSAARFTHWIYDTGTGRETNLEAITKMIRPWDDVSYNADASRVAFAPRPGDGEAVSILDLRTGRVRSYPLPAATPVRDTLLFGLTWSQSGAEVLVGRRWQDREDFWSINANSGRIEAVSARRVGGGNPMEDSIHYLRGGADIGRDCTMCGVQHPSDNVSLVGGARAVQRPGGDVALEKKGFPTVTLAKAKIRPPTPSEGPVAACDGGPDVGLFGAIDGRYVIYMTGGAYRIYGVAEKRSVALPGTYLAW